MNIELVILDDLNKLMDIYDLARVRMVNEGNLTQWDNREVFKTEIIEYINKKILYKVIENDEIVGYFAYISDIEHAYDVIDGKWLNQDKYITIHKIASKYNNKGIGGFIIKYVIDRCKNEGIYNIKIDTHKNNLSMNKFLTNKGIINCGVISLTLDFNDEYSLRNAYQLVIR